MSDVGVRVVDRLLVEVEVVVAERGLHVERHAPSSPPVGSPACPSPRTCPSMRPRRCRTTDDPGLFDATVNPLWAVGDKPNGGYLLALLGRAARSRPRASGGPDVGGRVLLHHLPAGALSSARPPCGRRCSAAGVRRPTCGPSSPRERTTWSTPCSSWPTSRSTRRRATTAPSPSMRADPEECVRLDPEDPDGVYVGIMDVLDLRLDPATLPFATDPAGRHAGRTAGLDAVRRRSGARRPLAPLFRRRHSAGHPHDRLHGLGADPADVRLRPGPARRPAGSASA